MIRVHAALARGALLPLLLGGVGCAPTEALDYECDCYAITAADIQVDRESSEWTVNGICAKVLHPSCPGLSKFEFRVGADSNGNGRLDPEEARTEIEDGAAGDEICLGSISGRFGDERVPILIEAKLWADGQDTFVYCKSDEIA